jgi:hypothetical protein
MSNPSDTTEFLAEYLPTVLAYGWAGYLNSGRGAVFVDLTKSLSGPQAENTFAHPMAYVHQALLEPQKVKEWEAPALERVKSYDPARQIVVLVYTGGTQMEILRLASCSTTPAQAHDKLRDFLPEILVDPAVLMPLLDLNPGKSNRSED